VEKFSSKRTSGFVGMVLRGGSFRDEVEEVMTLNLSEWDRASGVVALPQSIHIILYKIINKSHWCSTVSIKRMKITPWCAFYCKQQGMDKGPLLLSAEFPSGSLDPSQL
jgi:hypothetical protein